MTTATETMFDFAMRVVGEIFDTPHSVRVESRSYITIQHGGKRFFIHVDARETEQMYRVYSTEQSADRLVRALRQRARTLWVN